MTREGTKHIGAHIPQSIYDELMKSLISRHIKIQQFIEEAVEAEIVEHRKKGGK